jgi:ion channel-forming bestrophin family protein
MVAANPLFAGGSYYKKFKATIINDIWPEVLFFTAVGASESYRPLYSIINQGIDFWQLSGRTGLRADHHIPGDFESDVDRARYGARFGYILQNINGIREVRTYDVLAQCIVLTWVSCSNRFSEGRKLWTSIAIASRNLAQIVNAFHAFRLS